MGEAVRSPEDIMVAAQLAAALEASAWPKPGNVHRTADLGPKTFERFLAGSLALGPACLEAARRGLLAGRGGLDKASLGLGSLIERAVADDGRWQGAGPTHAGFAMLCVPLAASAGFLLGRKAMVNVPNLRKVLDMLLRATTVEDSIHLYRALRGTGSSKLGRLRPDALLPDVGDPKAEELLAARNLTLWRVLELSSSWDLVARELSKGLELCARVGFPRLMAELEEHGSLNAAVVNTYLALLAEAEDTHVARTWGLRETPYMPDAVLRGRKMARQVSERARKALELGGAATPKGLEAVQDMDLWLRSLGLNPGSCADLTACSLMLALLTGFRP